MNLKAYTGLEMSKRLAEAGIFQDEPEAKWVNWQGEKWALIDSYKEYTGFIAVPLWRLMEELPDFYLVSFYCGLWHVDIPVPDSDSFSLDKNLSNALALAHLKLAERKMK